MRKFHHFQVLDDCDVLGKYVILLGGTSGVGAHLARSLIPRGSIVTCLSRDPPLDKWSSFSDAAHLSSPSNGSLFWTRADLNCMQSIFDFAEVTIANNLIWLEV